MEDMDISKLGGMGTLTKEKGPSMMTKDEVSLVDEANQALKCHIFLPLPLLSFFTCQFFLLAAVLVLAHKSQWLNKTTTSLVG